MVLHKTYLGLNEDGSPHFNYYEDDPTQTLMVTGRIYGAVELTDGSIVDVSDDVISVPAAAALDVSDAIGMQHVRNGHPEFIDDPKADSLGFLHIGQDGVPVVNAGISDEMLAHYTEVLGTEPTKVGE